MRWTPLIAAASLIAASAAEAQVGCRGETLSELNDCVAAATPLAVEPADQRTRAPAPTARRNLGGTLQPRDLRAAPPVARNQNAPAEVGQVLSQTAREITSPESYGLTRDGSSEYYEVDGNVVRMNRTTREILDIRPIPGSVTGYDRPAPGAAPGQ